MVTRKGVVAAAVFLALSGCYFDDNQAPEPRGDGDHEISPVAIAKSEKARNLTPQIDTLDLRTQVANNTDFALAFYHKLNESYDLDGKNIVFSPYSISQAAAMLSAGAAGNTLSQLNQAMHFPGDQMLLHSTFNSLALDLASRNGSFTRPDNSVGTLDLNISNALWGQIGYPFQETFLDTLAVNYGAGLNLVDFATAPDAARLTINDWAADKTKNKILEAMPEGSIEARTRLVLTNTVYFKGAWQRPFLRKDTANGLFTRLDSSTVSAPFMHAAEATVRYASLPGVTAIELPFIGEKLSMLFVMPDVGTFANYSAGFEASKFADLTNTLQSKSVIVMLPKFDFGSDIPLSRVLKALGVADAFTDDADFSGIDGKPKFLQVTSAVHKALITVDEAGAEAVGFTGFVTGPTSIPQTVVFDRPFLFLIRDVETNSVLFVGRVLDPAVK